jgi:5-methylcytosine-specific restriction endonuclease McrA
MDLLSKQRKMKGGRAQRTELPAGPNGRALCRWCNLEVVPGRVTFCSEYCVEEWRLRTDPGFVRDKAYARDRGICALCKVNTDLAWRELRASRGAKRIRLLAHWGLKSHSRKSLWDADHVVPVVEGGGECDLSNIRTLCLVCHRNVTAQLRARRQLSTER